MPVHTISFFAAGLRPFGVSMLYAGWDKTCVCPAPAVEKFHVLCWLVSFSVLSRRFGFQLYKSDPSGNYNGWKATCIGANNQAATSLMKQEYKVGILGLGQMGPGVRTRVGALRVGAFVVGRVVCQLDADVLQDEIIPLTAALKLAVKVANFHGRRACPLTSCCRLPCAWHTLTLGTPLSRVLNSNSDMVMVKATITMRMTCTCI